MKKRKGKYFVHLYNKKNGCFYVEEREGYIITTDCGIHFGCTKGKGGWNVTEITTGYRCIVNECPTNMDALLTYIGYITPVVQRCLQMPCREDEITRFHSLIAEYHKSTSDEEVQL